MDSLCTELLASSFCGFDPSVAVTRAITNVVCTLVFSATYSHGDSELRDVLEYNDGIVQTIARGGLVDIYPWMKVGLVLGSQCMYTLFINILLFGTICLFVSFRSFQARLWANWRTVLPSETDCYQGNWRSIRWVTSSLLLLAQRGSCIPLVTRHHS